MNREDIQVLFDTHPNTDEFFITADDQAFFADNMADAHGQKLKNRTVTTVKREDLDAPVIAFVEVLRELNPSSPVVLDDAPPVVIPPATDDVPTAPVSQLEIAQATPEAERTSYQKGLITKAAKAAIKEGETK